MVPFGTLGVGCALVSKRENTGGAIRAASTSRCLLEFVCYKCTDCIDCALRSSIGCGRSVSDVAKYLRTSTCATRTTRLGGDLGCCLRIFATSSFAWVHCAMTIAE